MKLRKIELVYVTEITKKTNEKILVVCFSAKKYVELGIL